MNPPICPSSRRPAFHRAIALGELSAGYAADDGVALDVVASEFVEAVAERENVAAYRVEAHGSIEDVRIEARLLQVDGRATARGDDP